MSSRLRATLGIALVVGIVWPASCASTPQTDGNCETTDDCYSPYGVSPGTHCKAGRCECYYDDQVLCCERGTEVCNLSCRSCDQCAEGTHGCETDHGADAGADASAEGGADGSAEGGAGGGAGGGGGAQPSIQECASAADCPGPKDARCGKATCEEGVCGLDLQPVSMLVSQVRGDCHQLWCDGMGDVLVIEDGGDVYNDGKPCTMDVCEDGLPVNNPFPNGGTPCPDIGSGVCFEGECVECYGTSPLNHCGGGLACTNVNCVPMECELGQPNGVKDGMETGVDCGGPCAPCWVGQGCKSNDHCIEGVCFGGVCKVPSCMDGVVNDSETGVDCGSPNCGPCPDDEGCLAGENCKSLVCWAGKCQAPRCDDGIKNGDEVEVDCGGDCPACGQ